MTEEAPQLELLTHHLAECPAEFLLPPRIASRGDVYVGAVVVDLLRTISGDVLLKANQKAFIANTVDQRNRLSLVMVVCWLLYHKHFHNQTKLAQAAFKLLSEGLNGLAKVAVAEQFVTDSDRREELVRYCLFHLGLRPMGETDAQAMDRLNTLDSVERERVVRESQAARKRQREIQEALQRKAQEAAAAKVSRE